MKRGKVTAATAPNIGSKKEGILSSTIKPEGLTITAGQLDKRSGRGSMSLKKLVKAYGELSKFKLSTFVVLSSCCGFLLAGAPVAIDSLTACCVGVGLQSASASSLNQMYEIKTDSLMNRTRTRPLPSGRISKSHAAAFAVTTGIAGTAVLANFTNPFAAIIGASNIFLYAGIYTPLKQMTVHNTAVGAVVGALPVLVGYAAATGSVISGEAMILATALYSWQLYHFMALQFMYRKDYMAGGHKMISAFDPHGVKTASLMLRHTVILSALPLISYSTGITSMMFPLEFLALNGYLFYTINNFKQDPTTNVARKVFKTSLWYLPLFMFALVFHKNEWNPEGKSKSVVFSSMVNCKPMVINQEFQGVEDAFRCAKAYMKSKCLHEMLIVPPLARQIEQEQKNNNSLCPVTVIQQQTTAKTP